MCRQPVLSCSSSFLLASAFAHFDHLSTAAFPPSYALLSGFLVNYEYVDPSGGWGIFLFAGAAIYLYRPKISINNPTIHARRGRRRRETHLRNSIKIVSMVFSRFQFARQGSCLGSTRPFWGLTQGRLIWLTNWMVGGSSGYFSPQCILRL